MEPYEIEILKAYSTLFRNGPDALGRKDIDPCNDPMDFLRLSEYEQQDLLDWIECAFDLDEAVYPVSSYGLKHQYEQDTGYYITNGQFKGAMIQYGHEPVDPRYLNCRYLVKLTLPEEE